MSGADSSTQQQTCRHSPPLKLVVQFNLPAAHPTGGSGGESLWLITGGSNRHKDLTSLKLTAQKWTKREKEGLLVPQTRRQSWVRLHLSARLLISLQGDWSHRLNDESRSPPGNYAGIGCGLKGKAWRHSSRGESQGTAAAQCCCFPASSRGSPMTLRWLLFLWALLLFWRYLRNHVYLFSY